MGLVPEAQYKAVRVSLAVGRTPWSSLAMDVTEAEDWKQQQFGVERLQEALLPGIVTTPLSHLKAHIGKAVETFAGEAQRGRRHHTFAGSLPGSRDRAGGGTRKARDSIKTMGTEPQR